jgi:molybdopterin/thiamine biosynthesis adenylyltransferase
VTSLKRTRWWETDGWSIESEAAGFEADNLDFALDTELLNQKDVVVFRGVLRFGEQTTPASVHYPPAYAAGAQPAVFAPQLRLGRHQGPDGSLCLDHPILGESTPMYGAEAAARAERLWELWETDRDQLYLEEADAPDPRANYYDYAPDTALTMIDVDITGCDAGFLDLGATQLVPLRAGVVRVRATAPSPASFSAGTPIESFAGPMELHGAWRRVPEAPPFTHRELRRWVSAHHRAWFDEQLRFARAHAQLHKLTPPLAVVGFVYHDEGPKRGETHDAWLFLVVDPTNGNGWLARPFHLRRDERWLRQPQMRPMEEKRAAIVGVGALGSQIADMLAKAGLGSAFYLDHDIYTAGNRVRHQLDLSELGRAKVRGTAERALRVNPWTGVQIQGTRLGAAVGGEHESLVQEVDDRIVEELASCDLIVNAAANSTAGSYLSAIAHEVDRPVVHTFVSAGAWGARILVQRPGESACWDCLAYSQKYPERNSGGAVVPDVPSDPDVTEVMERGCADPTFTGPGFELAAAASASARVAVQVLLGADGDYPATNFDLLTLKFRDDHDAIPGTVAIRLGIHPDCKVCSSD